METFFEALAEKGQKNSGDLKIQKLIMYSGRIRYIMKERYFHFTALIETPAFTKSEIHQDPSS
jgi:hypothetical protein